MPGRAPSRAGFPLPTIPPHAAAVDEGALEALLEYARAHPSEPLRGGDVAARKSARLREVLGADADVEMIGPFTPAGSLNVLVVRRDAIVAELGDTGHADEIASATKSFLSTLAGIACDSGYISAPSASVFDDTRLPLLDSPRHRTITWEHLLQQTSAWDGELFGKHPSGHDGRSRPGLEPGACFEYNDVRVNLLARCLLEVFRRPLPDVLRERVMAPLGATSSWSWHGYVTSWVDVGGSRVQSVSGGAHWGGGIWMSSRDLARYGLLYLHDGRVDGRRLLSPEWIRHTRRSSTRNYMYGYLWWLQHDASGRQVCFAAQGGGSHNVFVVPEHGLVVVARWIADDAWPGFLDLALRLVADAPPLGPILYDFGRVNAS